MSHLTIDQIKQRAVPVLKKAGIKRSSLFGSYMRGDNREESDIDLLVEYPENISLFEVGKLKLDLEEVLGKPVDIVGYNSIKPGLKEYILSEQHTIL